MSNKIRIYAILALMALVVAGCSNTKHEGVVHKDSSIKMETVSILQENYGRENVEGADLRYGYAGEYYDDKEKIQEICDLLDYVYMEPVEGYDFNIPQQYVSIVLNPTDIYNMFGVQWNTSTGEIELWESKGPQDVETFDKTYYIDNYMAKKWYKLFEESGVFVTGGID